MTAPLATATVAEDAVGWLSTGAAAVRVETPDATSSTVRCRITTSGS